MDVNALAEKLASWFGQSKDTPAASGFKAAGTHWFAWWSNNLEDLEGEFFSSKAIDEYVMRVDVGAVPYPELWYWHTPGTRHGVAEWVSRIGHFAVAAGSFDDTPAGKAAQEHYAKSKPGYGMSHGFTYDPTQKADQVYHQFNTFELSVLPASAAANPYTTFEEVKAMKMSDQKLAGLKKLFGDELAAQLIEDTETKSAAVDQLDVRYKDFVKMIEEDVPVEDAPAEDDPAEGKDALAEMYAAVLKDVGTLNEIVNGLLDKLRSVEGAQTEADDVMDGEMSKMRKDTETMRKELSALRAEFADRPRSAARGDAAVLPEESPLAAQVKASAKDEQLHKALPGLFQS